MFPMIAEKGLATVAVVGENMKHTPGIAGKLFGTLGRSGISVIACAQGASETNISFVIDQNYLRKALNVIHDSFFLSEYQVLNIFICGVGTVGGSLIEQIHQANRQRLENDSAEVKPSHDLRPFLRYAAMVAAVAVVAVLLLFPNRQKQTMPVVAHNEMPQTVKQQLEETLEHSSIKTIKHSDYAYSETSDGVRVYCEDNCNPDEVLARMKHVIKTLQ